MKKREGLVADVKMASDLLQRLGFLINWEKSLPTPTQLMEVLGIILNSLSLAFMLPSVKGEKTHKLWVQALNHNRIKLRELAKVMEKFLLGHSGLAVRPDPLQESAVRTNLDGRNGGDFEKYLVLSEETKADLSWWIKSCIHQKEKLFFRANQI
jgi:hypothetical protein